MASSDDEFVLLQGFESLAAAQLAMTRLEAEGIPGLIPGENTIRINPHLPNPGGIKILVKRGDLMRARSLLQADEEEPAAGAGPELQCLKCGGIDVEELPESARSWLGRALGMLAAGLPIPARKGYRCRACGYRWRGRSHGEL